jgi:hypothetical protein
MSEPEHTEPKRTARLAQRGSQRWNAGSAMAARSCGSSAPTTRKVSSRPAGIRASVRVTTVTPLLLVTGPPLGDTTETS